MAPAVHHRAVLSPGLTTPAWHRSSRRSRSSIRGEHHPAGGNTERTHTSLAPDLLRSWNAVPDTAASRAAVWLRPSTTERHGQHLHYVTEELGGRAAAGS